MTPEVQIALIVAVPPTLVAAGAILVTLLAHRRANTKLDHITVLTNSTLSDALRRIEELEIMVHRLEAERDGPT